MSIVLLLGSRLAPSFPPDSCVPGGIVPSTNSPGGYRAAVHDVRECGWQVPAGGLPDVQQHPPGRAHQKFELRAQNHCG